MNSKVAHTLAYFAVCTSFQSHYTYLYVCDRSIHFILSQKGLWICRITLCSNRPFEKGHGEYIIPGARGVRKCKNQKTHSYRLQK